MQTMSATRSGREERLFLAADEIRWEPAASGPGEVRHLYLDPEDHMDSRLVRFPAGGGTGGEPGLLGRHVFVVDGDFEADGEQLRSGDCHRAAGGSVNGRTQRGCVLFSMYPAWPSAGYGEAPDVGTLDDPLTVRRGEERDGVLMLDADERYEVRLVRMKAGQADTLPGPYGTEELFVLRGDCLCQGRRLGPGHYMRRRDAEAPQKISSEGGCEVLCVLHRE